jgi:hypothetical protein
MTEPTRLKKFIQDQEEAVQLARETTDGSDPLRVDAINAALSLARTNAEVSSTQTTMAQLIADAKLAESYLKGS